MEIQLANIDDIKKLSYEEKEKYYKLRYDWLKKCRKEDRKESMRLIVNINSQIYCLKHPEKRKEYGKKYYEKHKEKIREYKRKYYISKIKGTEKYNEYQRRKSKEYYWRKKGGRI